MIDMNIGFRIKERRNELGLTQMQVYQSIGISSGNLSGIENGKILPSSTALIGLSNILECTVDYILKGDSLISENLSLSNIEKLLIDNFRSLYPDDKEEIMAIIQLKKNKVKRDINPRERSSHSTAEIA